MKWPTARLVDLCEINVGRTPSRDVSKYWGQGMEWLSIADMNQGREITRTKERITDVAIRECGCKLVPTNTLLLSFKLSVGKVAFSRIPLYTNEAIAALPIKRPDILGEYLFWFLKTADLLSGADKAAMGLTLNKAKLAEVEVPLPPLDEQRRIAAILEKAEALAEKRQRSIRKLDLLVGQLYGDTFGDPFSNPMNWPVSEVSRLLLRLPNYGSMAPPQKDPKEWLSLRVGNIQNWRLDLSDRKFIDVDRSQLDRFTVTDGDVLLARAIASQNHLGKCIVVYPRADKWAFDSHLMRLRFDNSKVLPEFFMRTMMNPGGRRLFLAVSRKSTVQYNVNSKEVLGLQLPIPPIDLQRRFVRSVQILEAQRELSDRQLVDINVLRDALIHQCVGPTL